MTAVSAVEALARHLIVTAAGGSTAERLGRYDKQKYRNPIELVEELVEPADLITYFGEDTWELFGYAVSFRNLVVHECTYVGYDKLHTLVRACEEVFEKLAAM